MYLALKGGAASQNHAHMDAGSFVFEASGVRWAHDLGMQDYFSLESKGIKLWSMGQDSSRWTAFRLNNFSHNALTIDEQLHRVEGRATITHFSATKVPGAVVDLSSVFAGKATSATRGFVFHADSHVLIRDELEGLEPGSKVRWAMLTKADIDLSSMSEQDPKHPAEAILSENGQRLRVQILASVAPKIESVSAAEPKAEFDAPNPGARQLLVTLTAPSSGRIGISVILQPLASASDSPAVDDKLARANLARWPIAPVRRG